MSTHPWSEDDEVMAAELALDLALPEERNASLARLAAEPQFAAAYARWQDYAAALFSEPGDMPRPSLWGAIVAQLPANDLGAPSSQGITSLRWWQAATMAASVAALVLATAVFQRQPAPMMNTAPATAHAPLVAVMTGANGAFITVSYDPADRRLTLAPGHMKLGDHSAELWIIPAGGNPRSLGVIAPHNPDWRAAPEAAVHDLTQGGTLAISLEPIGGSPTSQPTGAVIMTGKISTV